MLFPESLPRDPNVERWFAERPDDLGKIARTWFESMRSCGGDFRELIHDGQPTACVREAAFAYVDAFTAHVNVGFYLGAGLADPNGILEGTGKFMRHVKLWPDRAADEDALREMIARAYEDMKARIERAQGPDVP